MLGLLTLPVLGAAGYAVYRCGRSAATRRAMMLQPCAALLAAPVHGRDASGYGMLDGSFASLPVAVRLIPEDLAFRRLPQLWLSITVYQATGLPGTIDVVRRANSTEFYAPASELPMGIPTPPEWPGETLVRGSQRAETVLARAVAPIAPILADPRVKEVLLTPRGIRIVSQLCEGERSSYLLLRDSRFPLSHVSPEILQPRLEESTTLAHLITGEKSNAPPSHASA